MTLLYSYSFVADFIGVYICHDSINWDILEETSIMLEILDGENLVSQVV